MFQHLLPNPAVSYPRYVPPGWSNFKYQLQINLARVKGYYSTHPTAVNAQHLLIRMIHAMAIPKSLPVDRFYDNVANLSSDISSVFFLTSSYGYGKVHDGVFYNCPEVLFADFTPFDYEDVNLNWRTAEAVKVVYHPYNDLQMNLPEPERYPARTDFAFISINLAMLMVQYRAFRNEEIAYQRTSGIDMRSIYQFVRMHVLPNMLNSHLDIALMNIAKTIAEDGQLDLTTSMHSFPLINVRKPVTDCLTNYCLYFSKVGKGVEVVLNSMPLVAHGSIQQALYLPDDIYVGHNKWALMLAWLPLLEMSLVLAPPKSGRTNTNLRKEVIDGFKRLLVSNVYKRGVIPTQLIDPTIRRIENVINLFSA